MTAKEMFEALGYEQTTNSDKLIEYTNYSLGDGAFIRFPRSWKAYDTRYMVSIKEHEAITKQMKELGWI